MRITKVNLIWAALLCAAVLLLSLSTFDETAARVYGLSSAKISGRTTAQSTVVAISYTDFEIQDSAATTFTYTSKAIGAIDGNRRVIVATGSTVNASRTVSSVTVGGISATQAVTAESSGSGVYARTSIWIATVPSGTTANIVVTYSASVNRSAISVWAAYGLQSSTATSTGSSSSSSDPMTASLTINTGGIGVGMAHNYYGGGHTSYTWTNLTEDNDNVSGSGTVGTSGAHATGAFSGTITADPLGTSTYSASMVVAAFR